MYMAGKAFAMELFCIHIVVFALWQRKRCLVETLGRLCSLYEAGMGRPDLGTTTRSKARKGPATPAVSEGATAI